MNLKTKKRMAAEILKCSKSRVWCDPARLDEIKEAITKADIRGLINDKALVKVQATGVSRFRAREHKSQVKKGRHRGHGSRKGKKGARLEAKRAWMRKIRAQRDLLMHLKSEKIIDIDTWNELYAKAKGGFFRSRRHIKLFMEEHGMGKHGKK